jgi:hypothetical protein
MHKWQQEPSAVFLPNLRDWFTRNDSWHDQKFNANFLTLIWRSFSRSRRVRSHVLEGFIMIRIIILRKSRRSDAFCFLNVWFYFNEPIITWWNETVNPLWWSYRCIEKETDAGLWSKALRRVKYDRAGTADIRICTEGGYDTDPCRSISFLSSVRSSSRKIPPIPRW